MRAIIYYSLSGNTRDEVIDRFSGDFYRIEGKIKIPKRYFFQLAWLGFFSTISLKLKYKPIDIDLSKYDEVVIASPVWAFTFVPFLKKFLRDHPIKDKKVTLLLTHAGGPGKAIKKFRKWLSGNEIVEEIVIQKGIGYQNATLTNKK